jgi:hypothetical protein
MPALLLASDKRKLQTRFFWVPLTCSELRSVNDRKHHHTEKGKRFYMVFHPSPQTEIYPRLFFSSGQGKMGHYLGISLLKPPSTPSLTIQREAIVLLLLLRQLQRSPLPIYLPVLTQIVIAAISERKQKPSECSMLAPATHST